MFLKSCHVGYILYPFHSKKELLTNLQDYKCSILKNEFLYFPYGCFCGLVFIFPTSLEAQTFDFCWIFLKCLGQWMSNRPAVIFPNWMIRNAFMTFRCSGVSLRTVIKLTLIFFDFQNSLSTCYMCFLLCSASWGGSNKERPEGNSQRGLGQITVPLSFSISSWVNEWMNVRSQGNNECESAYHI